MDRAVLNEIKNVVYAEFVAGRLDNDIYHLYRRYLGGVEAKFLEHAEHVLLGKNDEYAEKTDVLKNFTMAAEIAGRSASSIAESYQLKHTVSILCLDKDNLYTDEYLFEKFGDWLNYEVLIYACKVDAGEL